MVDGLPGVLPDYLVELEIENLPNPSYDSATQTLEYNAYADLVNKKWIQETVIRNLTSDEIEQRRPKIRAVSPRQIRLAILQSGLSLQQIDSIINNIADSTAKIKAQVEWNYAIQFERDHPLIAQFGAALNLTSAQIDAIFNLAKTL